MGGFMFDNFNKLEIKKQKQILDGAMEEFSKYGYKKTSVEDIAKSAGISKSMVFYYFNTKLDLYNYLIIYSLDYIIKKYDNLYEKADIALSNAKETDNNQFIFFDAHFF